MNVPVESQNSVLAPGLFAELVNLAVDNGLKVNVNPDGSIAFYSVEPKQWMPCYPLTHGWKQVLRDMREWWKTQKDILPPTSKEELALRKIGAIADRLCKTHSRYPDCYVEGIKSIDAIANNLLEDRPKELNDRMQMDLRLETQPLKITPAMLRLIENDE